MEICETPGIFTIPSDSVVAPNFLIDLVESLSTFITFSDCNLLKGVETIISSISKKVSLRLIFRTFFSEDIIKVLETVLYPK